MVFQMDGVMLDGVVLYGVVLYGVVLYGVVLDGVVLDGDVHGAVEWRREEIANIKIILQSFSVHWNSKYKYTQPKICNWKKIQKHTMQA